MVVVVVVVGPQAAAAPLAPPPFVCVPGAARTGSAAGSTAARARLLPNFLRTLLRARASKPSLKPLSPPHYLLWRRQKRQKRKTSRHAQRSTGALLDLGVHGSRLSLDVKKNAKLYGPGVSALDILEGRVSYDYGAQMKPLQHFLGEMIDRGAAGK